MPRIKLGSLWGGMNSWFYHEFTVFSMGSISVKIAYYLGKFDYTISVMVLDSGVTVTSPSVSLWPIDDRAYHYHTMWCDGVFFFFC
jgi:hypothetical protein